MIRAREEWLEVLAIWPVCSLGIFGTERFNNIYSFFFMQESKILHYVLGLSLVMIAVFATGALVMVNSQADSISTSASVNNVAPTVSTVYLSSSANGGVDSYAGGTINDLVAGGTRTIHVNGIVEDANGNADITGVSGKFYRTSLGSSCSTSDNDCYVNASCTTDTSGGVTATQKRYNCSYVLNYYIDSTSAGGEFSADNFTAAITVTDAASASATDSALTKEVQTLLALNIPGTINFGSFALGAATNNTNNAEMVIAQNGNDAADVEVSMASGSLTCDATGTIPRGNIQWSTTDVSHGAGGTNGLTGTAADTNLAVPYRHGANPTRSLFWNIQIPSTGVKGSCTGTTTVSAIAS